MSSSVLVMAPIVAGGFDILRGIPRLGLRIRSLRDAIRLFMSRSGYDRRCVILSVMMMRCGRRRIVRRQWNVYMLLSGSGETSK